MLDPDHHIDLPQQYTTARAARRFSAIPKAITIFLLVVSGAMFIWIGEFPLTLAVIAFAYFTIVFTRKRLVRRALLRHRGKVCPCCWRPSDSPKPGCKGCEHPAGRRAHRVYWRLMRLTVVGAEQWFGDQFRVDSKQPPITRTVVLLVGILIAVPLLAMLYVVVMTVFFQDLSWVGGMRAYGLFWLVYLPVLGASGYFAKRRVGRTLHCAACEYQIAPIGPRPGNCPECGKDLSQPEAVAKGRQIGSPWGAVLPMLFFLVIVLLPLLQLSSRWQLSPSKLVPTSTYISNITARPDIDYTIKQELEQRRLDDGHLTQLLDEIERRLYAGKNLGLDGDPGYWGMNVSKLITTEAGQRALPHAMAVRILNLDRRFEDRLPFDLRSWARDEVSKGTFSQAELYAAESLRPINQVPTSAFVDQVVSAKTIDSELEQAITARRLEDTHIHTLLDEVERRIRGGSNFSPQQDPTYWGMNVGDLIITELQRRQVSHQLELRLLRLDRRYPERLPYDLKKWVRDAVKTGVFSAAELEQAEQ